MTLSGGTLQLEDGHLVARRHAIADALIRQMEDVLHEIGLIRVKDAGFLGVFDEKDQLVNGMDGFLRADRMTAETAAE